MKQKWFRRFWVCELVVQTSSYIGSKWGCWLNQLFWRFNQQRWFNHWVMLVQMVVLVEPAFEDGWASIFWRFNQQRWFNRQVMLVQNAGVGSTVRLCWFKMVVLVKPAFEDGSTSIFWRFNQHQHFEPTKLDGWTFIKWWLNQINAKK